MGRKDIITEEDFNNMSISGASPRRDSPGDSEIDAQAEIMMGMDFEPPKKSKPLPKDSGRRTFDDLPETAKVVSSEAPSPALDFDKESDTH